MVTCAGIPRSLQGLPCDVSHNSQGAKERGITSQAAIRSCPPDLLTSKGHVHCRSKKFGMAVRLYKIIH